MQPCMRPTQVITHKCYSKSADVYSFAHLFYELVTHHVPFEDRDPLQVHTRI